MPRLENDVRQPRPRSALLDAVRSGRSRAVVSAAAAATLLLLAMFFNDPAKGARDFATRYAAGVAVAHGDDPYDDHVVDPIEDRLMGVDQAPSPFRDPPPVALLFRAISAVPYDAAAEAWRVLMVACALGISLATARLLKVSVRSAVAISLLVALTLGFSPVFDGVNRVQVDPLYGLLAVIAFLASGRWFGGALQAVASLKPQTTLLAAAGGLHNAPRAFAASFAGGSVAIVAVTAGATTIAGYELSWSEWLDKVRASSEDGSATVAKTLPLAIVVVLGVIAWRRLVAEGTDRAVATLAVAASVNAVLGVVILQHSHSLVLLILPLALAARSHLIAERPRALRVLLGVLVGLMFGTAMFPLAYHSGRSHTLVPLAITALLAAASGIQWPRLWLPIGVGVVVNTAVALAALSPAGHDWLRVFLAILLAGHLATVTPLKPSRGHATASAAPT